MPHSRTAVPVRSTLPVIAALIAAVLLPASLAAQAEPNLKPSVPGVHVVLFTPAGLEPPSDAEEKIAASARYAEEFFGKWMNRWGYPPAREQIFGRGSDGTIRVLQVRGTKPSAEYDDALEVMKEVWADAHDRYMLPKDNPVWWVWVYKGDPPTRFDEYRGSGDLRRGGWAVVNYENRPGQIDPQAEMAAGFLHAFTLKGCVHEFGHALGLFHIGPIGEDRLGNTLMGPRTDPYRAASPRNARENQVYLSQAEAALLWKHWAFSGTAQGRASLPSVEVADYLARHDRSRNEIVVTGRLVSDGTAHSVVLIDEAPPRQQDYSRKAYAVRIGEEGRFEVRVREPSGAAGAFRLMFCFENGAITGDGKSRELEKAFTKRYAAAGRSYRFEE